MQVIDDSVPIPPPFICPYCVRPCYNSNGCTVCYQNYYWWHINTKKTIPNANAPTADWVEAGKPKATIA